MIMATQQVNMSIVIMAKQQVTICVSDCLLVFLLGLFVCLKWMVTICVSETKVHHSCDHVCSICVFAWLVAWIGCLSVCIVVLYYCVDCLFAAASLTRLYVHLTCFVCTACLLLLVYCCLCIVGC